MYALPLVYNPNYHITGWKTDHRFPMPKYQLLHQLLIQNGVCGTKDFHQAKPAPRSALERVHLPGYLDDFQSGNLDQRMIRRIGLPWSKGLVDRTLASSGGTLMAGHLALKHGMACNLGGGTHHAFPDYGSGFCIFNDVSVALRQLRAEARIRRALIVDLDVHQGDGTAWIHREEPELYTFSMHCGENFPFQKQQSDLDLSLHQGMEDAEYLQILKNHLPSLIRKHQPDLIFYNAGCDAHRDDPLGKLELTSEGLFERDSYVFQTALEAGVPIASVLGGGYSPDHDEIAQRHSIVVRAASEVHSNQHN